MAIKNIIKLANFFEALASSEKLPENSKDLKTILKNIESLENYNSRKEYAEANLKHLSSGSSRIVYLTSKNTVIKLAKNDRGIAQNKVECNDLKSKFLNRSISHAKDYSWIETYFLDKITTKSFDKMTGISFDDFGECIRYGLKNVSKNSANKPKNFETVEKTEIYKSIKEIGSKLKLLPGDLARISSWGCKDNHPVLIDAGLSKDVYDDYYDSSS